MYPPHGKTLLSIVIYGLFLCDLSKNYKKMIIIHIYTYVLNMKTRICVSNDHGNYSSNSQKQTFAKRSALSRKDVKAIKVLDLSTRNSRPNRWFGIGHKIS